MSSIIFQPLLHDPLGWKQSTSTYTDTYVWKTLRANKNAKLSKYGQQYQKEFEKQQKLQERNQQETIDRILATNQVVRSPTKTPSVALDQPPVLIVEYKPRPPSANRVCLLIFIVSDNLDWFLFRRKPIWAQELRTVHQHLWKVSILFLYFKDEICSLL